MPKPGMSSSTPCSLLFLCPAQAIVANVPGDGTVQGADVSPEDDSSSGDTSGLSETKPTGEAVPTCSFGYPHPAKCTCLPP